MVNYSSERASTIKQIALYIQIYMYKMKKLQSNTKAYTLDFPVNIFC